MTSILKMRKDNLFAQSLLSTDHDFPKEFFWS